MPRIRGYCRRFTHDAEHVQEIIADVMAELITNGEPVAAGVDEWCAARNVLRRICAAEKRSTRALRAFAREASASELSADSLEDDEERAASTERWIAGKMEELTPRQREAINFRFIQEMSYETTATNMRVSQGAVRVHIHAALRKLRGSPPPRCIQPD